MDRKEKSGSVDHHDIEQFLFMEAKLLDQKRFNEWADLFCEDGTYWIPTEEEQVDPYSHASIIFDDKQSMMARIRRLGHPMIHAQSPPSRTTHIVTNIMTDLRMDKKEEFLVDACFTMFEYRDDEQLMYGGRYTYNLKILGGLLLIDKKIVKLVNSDAAHNIMAVYI